VVSTQLLLITRLPEPASFHFYEGMIYLLGEKGATDPQSLLYPDRDNISDHFPRKNRYHSGI